MRGFKPHSDGSSTYTFNGPTLFGGSHFILDGRAVYQVDSGGNVTSSTIVGSREDLCPELAGS